MALNVGCALGALGALALMAGASGAEPRRASPSMDAATRAWWHTTGALSGDDMRGRDTGSEAHRRAVDYVVGRFRSAGLAPAGDAGGFTQTVPLHEVRVETDRTSFGIVDDHGTHSLRFLHDISVRPSPELPPTLAAAMSFRGYCGATDVDSSLTGKILVCFASRRAGMPAARDRLAAAASVGATGLINIDDAGFTVEPPRWPEAYARAVTLRSSPPPEHATLAVMRLNTAAAAAVLAGSGHAADALLADGAAGRPLPHFDLPARFSATFSVTQRDYASDNVLARLPGTDSRLAPQIVVISAHLDAYGIGEPVDGDAIYNGTFDDAAYVATLIQFAERRRHHGYRRTVLFAVFTGEEKGLLGSTWFTQHPTVPGADLAADINLDGVRPLFPLKILTAISLAESSLGDAARATGAELGIEIRADREPERNMRERTDHWPFLKAGIPAICFMFGYDPGSGAEALYRRWYRDRYHKPQDDLGQPFDGTAARDFNEFAYRLLGRVADQPERPAMAAFGQSSRARRQALSYLLLP